MVLTVELEVAQALVDLENGVPELKTELRPLQVAIRILASCSRMIKRSEYTLDRTIFLDLRREGS